MDLVRSLCCCDTTSPNVDLLIVAVLMMELERATTSVRNLPVKVSCVEIWYLQRGMQYHLRHFQFNQTTWCIVSCIWGVVILKETILIRIEKYHHFDQVIRQCTFVLIDIWLTCSLTWGSCFSHILVVYFIIH